MQVNLFLPKAAQLDILFLGKLIVMQLRKALVQGHITANIGKEKRLRPQMKGDSNPRPHYETVLQSLLTERLILAER